MAITTIGFDGTINEAQFANLMILAGVRNSVLNAGDFEVSVTNDASHQLSVAPGWAYSAGVAVNSDEESPFTLDPWNGDDPNWYLFVLRRNWSNNVGSIVVLGPYPGTGSGTGQYLPPPSAWPDDMEQQPGAVDDQPLAWVGTWEGVNPAGSTTVVVDLRAGTLDARLPNSLFVQEDAPADPRVNDLWFW